MSGLRQHYEGACQGVGKTEEDEGGKEAGSRSQPVPLASTHTAKVACARERGQRQRHCLAISMLLEGEAFAGGGQKVGQAMCGWGVVEKV